MHFSRTLCSANLWTSAAGWSYSPFQPSLALLTRNSHVSGVRTMYCMYCRIVWHSQCFLGGQVIQEDLMDPGKKKRKKICRVSYMCCVGRGTNPLVHALACWSMCQDVCTPTYLWSGLPNSTSCTSSLALYVHTDRYIVSEH